MVPILPIVRAGIADYIAKCPWPIDKGTPLFRGAKGGPLSQGMVQKAMARARIALGSDWPVVSLDLGVFVDGPEAFTLGSVYTMLSAGIRLSLEPTRKAIRPSGPAKAAAAR